MPDILEWEKQRKQTITIPFGLKFDQEATGSRTFFLYLKSILAHDSPGEASDPKKGPKLFEESVELKVTVGEDGEVEDVETLMK